MRSPFSLAHIPVIHWSDVHPVPVDYPFAPVIVLLDTGPDDYPAPTGIDSYPCHWSLRWS
uniref:Uncharacterized protein n=1 Tax=Tetranychus urticae TaxID=32264 RepID=T1L4P6_TETUR